MSASTPRRLDELEARYTHLERQVTELSDVVWKQQRQLDKLAEAFERVRERLAEQEPGLVDAAVTEKPPHY